MLAEKQRITREIERAIAAETVEAWLVRLGAAGVPSGPVFTRESVQGDVQARANGLLQDVEQPGLGTTTMLGGVFRLDGAEPAAARPAPALGADTDAVLAEVGA